MYLLSFPPSHLTVPVGFVSTVMTDTENPNPNPTPPQESGMPDSSFTPAQLRVLPKMLVECADVPAGGAAG